MDMNGNGATIAPHLYNFDPIRAKRLANLIAAVTANQSPADVVIALSSCIADALCFYGDDEADTLLASIIQNARTFRQMPQLAKYPGDAVKPL